MNTHKFIYICISIFSFFCGCVCCIIGCYIYNFVKNNIFIITGLSIGCVLLLISILSLYAFIMSFYYDEKKSHNFICYLFCRCRNKNKKIYPITNIIETNKEKYILKN